METKKYCENCKWAWLAGFFEGEGTFGVYRSKCRGGRSYIINFRIWNTDRRLIERAWEICKQGRIYQRKAGTIPDKYGVVHRKTRYVLQIAGTQSLRPILEAIYPFLVSKKRKRKCEILLKILDLKKRFPEFNHGRLDEYRKLMDALCEEFKYC